MQTQKQPVLSAVSPKHAPNVLMVPPRRLAQGGSLAAHSGPQLARDPRGGERREHGGVGARRERERERALTSRDSPPPPHGGVGARRERERELSPRERAPLPLQPCLGRTMTARCSPPACACLARGTATLGRNERNGGGVNVNVNASALRRSLATPRWPLLSPAGHRILAVCSTSCGRVRPSIQGYWPHPAP